METPSQNIPETAEAMWDNFYRAAAVFMRECQTPYADLDSVHAYLQSNPYITGTYGNCDVRLYAPNPRAAKMLPKKALPQLFFNIGDGDTAHRLAAQFELEDIPIDLYYRS